MSATLIIGKSRTNAFNVLKCCAVASLSGVALDFVVVAEADGLPALATGDGTVCGGNAVCRYLALAKRSGPSLQPEALEVDGWLEWEESELQPILETVLAGVQRGVVDAAEEQIDAAAGAVSARKSTRRAAEQAEQLAVAYSKLAAALQRVEAAVSGRPFLAGDALTLADLVIASSMYYSVAPEAPLALPPSLGRAAPAALAYAARVVAAVPDAWSSLVRALATKPAKQPKAAKAASQSPAGAAAATDAAAATAAASAAATAAASAPKEAKKKSKGKAQPAAAAQKPTTPVPKAAPHEREPFVDPPRRLRAARSREPVLPKSGERNVLITSALPYVNNVPHLGNIIGCVLSADVYARFLRQRGVNTIYICGTDEYGTATETKAAEEGLTPRQLCDRYHAVHRDIYEWFDISFDHFGRTSCPNPRAQPDWPQTQIAQGIFMKLLENKHLLEQTVEQVYCLGCSKFLADRYIEGTCPKCGYGDARGDQCDGCGGLLNATELLEPRCKTSRGHKVEVRTSEHMFLDLPGLQPRLEAWVDHSSEEGAWSSNSVQITKSWIRDGLKPRCITRDLQWGTPVPLERYNQKVFYVWFDAPIGYISITATYTPEWERWWKNPDEVRLVQFMGKDNIPFHTVIFPSSLIGTEEPWTLLHHVSTTEFLNYEDGKFSKSRNVGVFGDGAKETGIAPEVWRYYLLVNRPEMQDSVFVWSDFASKNNNELLKNLGNFVNRALAFTYNKLDGRVPKASAPDERDTRLVRDVNVVLREYIDALESVKLRQGLRCVMEVSRLGNQYLQDAAPWKMMKSDPERAHTTLAVAISLIKLLAAVAEPYMPGFADKVYHQLNLDHAQIPDEFIVDVPAGHPLNKPTPLFREILPEEVESFRLRFGGRAEAGAAEAGAAASTAAAAEAAAV